MQIDGATQRFGTTCRLRTCVVGIECTGSGGKRNVDSLVAILIQAETAHGCAITLYSNSVIVDGGNLRLVLDVGIAVLVGLIPVGLHVLFCIGSTVGHRKSARSLVGVCDGIGVDQTYRSGLGDGGYAFTLGTLRTCRTCCTCLAFRTLRTRGTSGTVGHRV